MSAVDWASAPRWKASVHLQFCICMYGM